MKTSFEISAPQCGRKTYNVMRDKKCIGHIAFFDKSELLKIGNYEADPHWVLLKINGRIERFDTLKEAKEEALKIWQRGTQ